MDEISSSALPALARALSARPNFFARVGTSLAESDPLAGESRDELPEYLREFAAEDPLILAAAASPRRVEILEHAIDPRVIQRSRAFQEFHRPRDMEHHLLVRISGDRLTTPGGLVMGFTRGRRQPTFSSAHLEIAHLVLAALQGSVQRIARERLRPRLERATARLAEDRELTAGELAVFQVLLLGVSNQEIASRLRVSLPTVKTHLQRIYRKFDVDSRARLIALVREELSCEGAD